MQNLPKELSIEMLGALLSSAITALAKLYLSRKGNFDEAALEQGIDAIWNMIKR